MRRALIAVGVLAGAAALGLAAVLAGLLYVADAMDRVDGER